MFLHTLVMFNGCRLVCFFFRLAPFPFSFSNRREGGMVIRRTRSGSISSSYVTSSSLLDERGNDYEVPERQSRKSENSF